jgi:hypothetical protein
VRRHRLLLVAVSLVLTFLYVLPGCGADPKPTFTLRPTPALFPYSQNSTATATSEAEVVSTPNAPLVEPSPSSEPAPETQLPPIVELPTATQDVSSPTQDVSSSTTNPAVVWLGPDVPLPVTEAMAEFALNHAGQYVLTEDRSLADVHISSNAPEGTPLATWVYALVAPFSTIDDGLSWEALRSSWAGVPAGPFAGRPLLTTEETLAAMASVLGQPAAGAVVTLPESELLQRAWSEQPAWALVPFDGLESRWKVLRVDGLSPLDKGLDLDRYPLVVRIGASGSAETLEPLLSIAGLPATNRDENLMTTLVMTGVTALTRATAWRMEQNGMTYPARDIGDWLRNADFTHVSNEVSFDPECGAPNPVQEGLLFCSDPRYIELLEDVGVDIVEMTGNHIADAGVEHIEPTLDMYVERGWEYFGGGRNLEDARKPAMIEHNGNRLAFLGCNPVGPAYVWADAERAGAAPCDYELLYSQIAELRSQGILPIVTLQYWELDRYDPTPQQVEDFQALIDAGAAIVSGSQAHHVQGFGFRGDGFIHYGVGNLFFDQMQMLGYMQEFIDRHVFYDGRHISTELLTAMLEDWSRPRPMTDQERQDLLRTVFAVSTW